MLNKFKETIEQKIALSTKRNIDESNTKAYLIEPLLKILGYDVYDILTVQREYKIADYDKDDSVDYAIMIEENPVIFIEAKRIGEDIDNPRHKKQLRRYYNSNPSIKYAILTNGRYYHLYADIDNDNIMDNDPILRIDVLKNIDDTKDIEFPEILNNRSYFIQRKQETFIKNELLNNRDEIIDTLRMSFEGLINNSTLVNANIQISETKFVQYLSSLIQIEPTYEKKHEVEKTIIVPIEKEVSYILSDEFDSTGYKIIEADVFGKISKDITFKMVLNHIVESVPNESLDLLLSVNKYYKSKKHLHISKDVTGLNESDQKRFVEYQGFYIGANLSSNDTLKLCRYICQETKMDANKIVFKLGK